MTLNILDSSLSLKSIRSLKSKYKQNKSENHTHSQSFLFDCCPKHTLQMAYRTSSRSTHGTGSLIKANEDIPRMLFAVYKAESYSEQIEIKLKSIKYHVIVQRFINSFVINGLYLL